MHSYTKTIDSHFKLFFSKPNSCDFSFPVFFIVILPQFFSHQIIYRHNSEQPVLHNNNFFNTNIFQKRYISQLEDVPDSDDFARPTYKSIRLSLLAFKTLKCGSILCAPTLCTKATNPKTAHFLTEDDVDS